MYFSVHTTGSTEDTESATDNEQEIKEVEGSRGRNFKYCSPCRTWLRSEQELEVHLQTKKHQRRFQEMGGVTESTPHTQTLTSIDNEPEEIDSFPHWCALCNVETTCKSELKRHSETKKHLKRIREEEWKRKVKEKCSDPKIVEDLKCLVCCTQFPSKPELIHHLESDSHKNFAELKAARATEGQEAAEIEVPNSSVLTLETTEEDVTEETPEPMATSDSSVVVQVEKSGEVDEAPALEEMTHLNNIPIEDIIKDD